MTPSSVFVESNLAGRTALKVDPAWTPQSTLLADYARETPLDFIGRVERLEEDMSYILSRIDAPAAGLAQKVAESLSRAEASLPRALWLTRAREERIRRIFERDYARLGYDFLCDG